MMNARRIARCFGVAFGVCLAFCSLFAYAVLCAIGSFLAGII